MDINVELEKKIVVYTVIMGDYDYLKDPEFIMDNCDYICFTNNPNLKSNVWTIRMDMDGTLDNTKWQRRHKVLAHEYLQDYEWSIYVDGNVRLIGDFREYIRHESTGLPMLCLKHPNRNNVFDELEECISLGKDDQNVMIKQIEGYKEEGYKGDNGLTVTNVLVRKHMDPQIINLMKLWWEEIENKSKRDQLSINYCCWKLNVDYDVSEYKCWKSPYWLNPGIHTSDLKVIEQELIEHIQLEDYYEYKIREQEKYIELKEQELKDANTLLGWKQQELKDANTQLEWKKQELKDANTRCEWKEQELNLIKNSKRWKLVNMFRRTKNEK